MGRIVQFGTSRFLQAHVDLFVHEAREAGQDVGPITVVKTTAAGPRDARVRAFGRPGGFQVMIRGLVDGAPLERTVVVRSVDRGISAEQDWREVRRLLAGEVDLVVCNTGDSGYADAGDAQAPAEGEAPRGFPAKLLALLLGRHAAGGRPITVLPCELINSNGQALRQAMAVLARRWRVGDDAMAWLDHDVIIADTLVDRIVSEPLDPIGAVAEPYALWAIQRCSGLAAPMQHASVVMTDALEPYARLKLHILNLGHTVLAETWARRQRPLGETVREILADAAILDALRRLYQDEIVPGFALHGMAAEAERYVATTLERLMNPFLNHRLADIWQNHAVKVDRRVHAFLAWTAAAGMRPRLAAIADAYPPHSSSQEYRL